MDIIEKRELLNKQMAALRQESLTKRQEWGEKFPDRLKKLEIQHKDFAKIVRVTPEYISKIYNKRALPHWGVIRRIDEAFKKLEKRKKR